MKIAKVIVAATAAALFLSACSTTASLYPVDGPYSKQTPLPVIEAKVEGISGNSGRISLSLPDGERCIGRWSSIAPTTTEVSTAAGTASAQAGLSQAWVTAYGTSVSHRNMPGINRGEAMLVGNRGTVINIEFFTGSGTANGTGVGKDNRGNIYKVLF